MSKIRPSTQIMASGTPSATTYLRGDDTWATVSGGSSVLDWVSVKDHGAVGDGTADDTSAIQAAVNATPAGGTCYFPLPSVEYKITAAINVPHAMKLTGGGSFIGQYTRVHQTTASTSAFVNTISSPWNAWVVEGLELIGTGGTDGAGIRTYQSVNVRECFVRGFYDALYVYSTNTTGEAFYCVVENSYFDQSVRAGIVLASIINNFSWVNCRANSNATGVFVAGGPLGFRMYGGSVEGNTSVGIDLDGHATTPSQDTNAAIISGLYFEGNGPGTTDVRIGNTSTVYGARVESCAFIVGAHGDPTWHINAPNVNSLTITDNTFWGTACVTVGSTNPGVVWGPNYNKNSGTVTLPTSAIRLDSANVTPSADGTAAVGTSLYLARADHVHPSSGGGSLTVQDENANVATGVTQIDFQGAGVTATAGTGEVVVTIPGGSGSLTVQDEGTALTQRSTIDFVGAGVTATDDAANSRTVVTIPGGSGGGSSGALLAVKQYRPTASTAISTNSATSADVDATNLAVTFTAPTSGQVLVRLNAVALFSVEQTVTSADAYLWCVRDSAGLVAGTETAVFRSNAYHNDGRATAEIVVSGLTSGSSYTWKWGHMLSAGDASHTGRILCGNTGGSPAIWGGAVMSVWAA